MSASTFFSELASLSVMVCYMMSSVFFALLGFDCLEVSASEKALSSATCFFTEGEEKLSSVMLFGKPVVFLPNV